MSKLSPHYAKLSELDAQRAAMTFHDKAAIWNIGFFRLIEYKYSFCGRARGARSGLSAIAQMFKPNSMLLAGSDRISVGEFLARPMAHWVTT